VRPRTTDSLLEVVYEKSIATKNKYKNFSVCNTCKSDQITHPKQHKSFFWDNVIERSHFTYNPLDVTPVNVSLHSKLVTL